MILLIDDEPKYALAYCEELEDAGWKVAYRQRVDDVIPLLKEAIDDIKLVVLDVMMAPGSHFANDDRAQKGLRTGIPLFEYIRQLKPDLPIIVLTHLADGAELAEFKQKEHCWIFKKDLLARQLASFITDQFPAMA